MRNFTYHGEEFEYGRKRLFLEPRCYGRGSDPDPNAAAAAGIQQTEKNYPFSYIVNALSQTGGNATLTNPATGQPQDYNFTDLGTTQVGNQVSGQMAQVLLDLQNQYGGAYIAQRLADLKQSDPTGYAAYGQLFDQIQQEAAQQPPDMPLSQATQAGIQDLLQKSNTLTPTEQTQVAQQSNAGNVATGVYLGNAPAQVNATNAVNAVDQQNAAAQGEASKFLASGVSPSDVQYRKIQQDMANYGAFINGQNPTAEFSSLSGAQSGAAPAGPTGYQTPTLNVGQAAQQGISQANSLYGINQQQANPYLAGLNFASQGVQAASNLGWNPFASASPYSIPTSAQYSNLSGGAGPVSSSYANAGSSIGASDINAINTGSDFNFGG